MEYLSVDAAKNKPGLRLVLTRSVPGPWSEAAKALFRLHNVDFIPVEQKGGGRNLDLLEWTRHRNAPIALHEDEAPRVRWLEILDLAERLGSGPTLIPADRSQRIQMIGLINEIAGEGGLAWNARHLMLNVAYQTHGAEGTQKNPMYKDYQYNPETINLTKEKVEGFLADLAAIITSQKASGSDYLVGTQFTAADVYWSYFSNMLEPLPTEQNPMPDGLRQTWAILAWSIGSYDPIVIEHRDECFSQHLGLPLDF